MLGNYSASVASPAVNRRHAARFKVDFRLRAQISNGVDKRTVHGQANDLSAGGISVYLATDLALGEVIELEFTPPYATRPVQVNGIVRNRRSYQYGLEFTKVSATSAGAIQRACVSLALVP